MDEARGTRSAPSAQILVPETALPEGVAPSQSPVRGGAHGKG